MANKVIQAVLKFRDDMSKGLLGAARNAKKAGVDINNDMMAATKKVVAFKNKTVSALSDAAKAAVKWAAATSAAMVGGLLAMDGATEEYRIAQGKLNTAFEAAGLGAEAARQAYSGFYDILGDTDTATEASQLLAKLAQNTEDISVWTRIAAGVSGTFGDSLPIEGLIEATNETAKVGQVTGVLADALNWAGISEDDFNTKLEGCSSEAERNTLLMETLAKTYDSAAESFYKNNKEIVTARANHRALMAVMAKLGQTSASLKNSLAKMFGFDGKGGIRAGSIMDMVSQKAGLLGVKLQQFQQNGTIDTIAQKLDAGLAWAGEKAGKAAQFLKDNADKLIPVLKAIAAVFVATKVAGFVSGLGKAAKTVSDLTAMLGVMANFNGFAGIGKVFGGLSGAFGAIGSPIKTLQKLPSMLSSLPGKFMGPANNIGGVFVGLPGKILGAIKGIPGVVVGFFKGIPGVITGLFKGLAGGIKSAFSGILSFFTGLPGKLIGFFKAIPGAVVGFFKAIPATISGVFSNPAGWGFAAIIAAVAGVVAAGVLLYRNWDAVKTKAIELWGQLKSNLAPAFDTVKSVASQVAQFFTGTVVPAASALWGKIKEVASAFVTAMAPAASVVLGIVSQLASFFVGSVVPAIVSVVGFIGQLASAFLTVATPAINAVMSIIGVLANIFSSVVAPAIGLVATVITGLASIFTSVVVAAVTAVLNTAQTLAGFFTGVLSPAIETVRSIAQRLSEFLTGVLGPAFDAVKGFAQRLVDFFSGVLTGAIEAVRGAFNRVKDAIQNVISKIQAFLGMNTTKTVTVNTVYKSSGNGHASTVASRGNSLGTPYWRGGPTWVNERGGEIIKLPNSVPIIPKDAQKRGVMGQLIRGEKTFVDLPHGTQIITHDRSVKQIEKNLFGRGGQILRVPSGQQIIPQIVPQNIRKNFIIGHNAMGSSYWHGGFTEINERGGEIIKMPGMAPIVPASITNMMKGGRTIVNLPSGTQIIPHDRSLKMVKESVIGHNVMGSSYWHGGFTEINERGGEIVQLPGGNTVVPESIISRISNSVSSSRTYGHESRVRESGGRKINITVNAPVTINGNADEKSASKFVDIVARKFRMALENYA